MSEEEEIRIRINSSLISFGSAGTNLNQFCDVFRSDWSENLIDHAHRLGFSSGNPINDITSMLRKFEQICAVIVLPSGEILLKPIADEDTKENLAIIDKTNKDIAKQKAIRESIRERSRMPNPNLIQLPPMQLRNLCGPPPPPHFPTQAIPMLNRIPPPPGFFRNEQMVPPQLPVPSPLRLPSAQISPSQQSMPPPNLPGGKNNANLEPLGQRRPSLHSQNHKSFYLQSITTNQSSVSQPLPQRRIFSNAMRANAPMINDFGDQIGAAQKIKKNKTNINIRNHPLSSKGGLGSQQIFQNDNVDSKYGDEDFWAPPSNGTSGSTNTRSRERVDIWEEYDDEDVENGMKGEEEEWMEANDGDEDEEEYWECESEWQLDFGLEEEWAEENGEYREFIIGNEQQCPSIPTDLYRLIYLFCANGGIYSSSKMDALKKAYNEAFNATFTSKEWNRLLGNEELIKIFKDSFKKCKWPASEMFKVLEKTSTYNIELLPCLTDYSVNPFAFFRQNIATSSAQSNRALPLPISIGPQRHDSQSPALSSCRTSRPNPSMISPSSHFSKGDQGLNNSSNLAQFTTLAVFAQELLFKAKNGPKKPLSDLFDRIKTTALPDQFSEALLASKPIFLGYLRLFNHSFRVEFQDDDIFITAMKFHPISQNFSIPIDFSNGNQLRLYKGDRHKVKIVDYKSGIYAILHLPQIFNTLQELLSDYQQILEDLCEPPAKKVVSNQLIFFLDPANKSLCRGKFIRTDGKERAIVQDIDTRRERFILLKDIFEIPQNFPSWRFPPYQFSAQFIGLNEANLKKMWAQRDLEFAVDIVDVEEMPNFSRVRLAEQ